MLSKSNSKSPANGDFSTNNNSSAVSSDRKLSFSSDQKDCKKSLSVTRESDTIANIQQVVQELISDLLFKVENFSDSLAALTSNSTRAGEQDEIKLISKSVLDVLFYTEKYLQSTQPPASADSVLNELLNAKVRDIGDANAHAGEEDTDIMMVSLNNYLLFDDGDHDNLSNEPNASLGSKSAISDTKNESNVISGKQFPSVLVKSTLLQMYNNYLSTRYKYARKNISWPDAVKKLYKIQMEKDTKKLCYIQSETAKTEMDLKDAKSESLRHKATIEDLKRIEEGNSLTKRIEKEVLKQDTKINFLKNQLEEKEQLYSIYKRRMAKVRAEMVNLKKLLATERNDLTLLRKKAASIKAEIKASNKNYQFQASQIKNAAVLNELRMSEQFRRDLSKAIKLIRQEFEVKLRIKKDELDSNYKTVWDVIFHKINRLYKTPKLSQIIEIISLKKDVEYLKKESTNTRKQNKNLVSRINHIFSAIEGLDYGLDTARIKKDEKIILNRKLEDLKEKERKAMEEEASLNEELDRLRHLLKNKTFDEELLGPEKITTPSVTTLGSNNTKVIKSSLKNSQSGKNFLRKNVKFFPVVFQRYISLNTVPLVRNEELLRTQLS